MCIFIFCILFLPSCCICTCSLQYDSESKNICSGPRFYSKTLSLKGSIGPNSQKDYNIQVVSFNEPNVQEEESEDDDDIKMEGFIYMTMPSNIEKLKRSEMQKLKKRKGEQMIDHDSKRPRKDRISEVDDLKQNLPKNFNSSKHLNRSSRRNGKRVNYYVQ